MSAAPGADAELLIVTFKRQGGATAEISMSALSSAGHRRARHRARAFASFRTDPVTVGKIAFRHRITAWR